MSEWWEGRSIVEWETKLACQYLGDQEVIGLICRAKELEAEVERLKCRIENEIGGGLGSMDKDLCGVYVNSADHDATLEENARLTARCEELECAFQNWTDAHGKAMYNKAIAQLADAHLEIKRLTVRCEKAREIISEIDSISNRVTAWLQGRP